MQNEVVQDGFKSRLLQSYDTFRCRELCSVLEGVARFDNTEWWTEAVRCALISEVAKACCGDRGVRGSCVDKSLGVEKDAERVVRVEVVDSQVEFGCHGDDRRRVVEESGTWVCGGEVELGTSIGGDCKSGGRHDVVRGPDVGFDNGGVSSSRGVVDDDVVVPVVSERTLFNREKRARAKARKQRKQGLKKTNCENKGVVAVKSDLQVSLEAKWKAENELAVERAKRSLDVLKANSVDDEVRRYRTRVCAQTERNMVAIENVHSKLKASGNSTDDDDSRVQTVVSGSSSSGGIGSGTISPNSSVSEAEVRKLQKDFADVQKKLEESMAINEKYAETFKFGVDLIPYVDKDHWTLDSKGRLPESKKEIIDRLYPNGYTRQQAEQSDGGRWYEEITGFY